MHYQLVAEQNAAYDQAVCGAPWFSVHVILPVWSRPLAFPAHPHFLLKPCARFDAFSLAH